MVFPTATQRVVYNVDKGSSINSFVQLCYICNYASKALVKQCIIQPSLTEYNHTFLCHNYDVITRLLNAK